MTDNRNDNKKDNNDLFLLDDDDDVDVDRPHHTHHRNHRNKNDDGEDHHDRQHKHKKNKKKKKKERGARLSDNDDDDHHHDKRKKKKKHKIGADDAGAFIDLCGVTTHSVGGSTGTDKNNKKNMNNNKKSDVIINDKGPSKSMTTTTSTVVEAVSVAAGIQQQQQHEIIDLCGTDTDDDDDDVNEDDDLGDVDGVADNCHSCPWHYNHQDDDDDDDENSIGGHGGGGKNSTPPAASTTSYYAEGGGGGLSSTSSCLQQLQDQESEEYSQQQQYQDDEEDELSTSSHNNNSSYACQLAKRLESIDAMDVVNNSSDDDDEDSTAAMYNCNKQNNNNKDDSCNDINNYSSECCFSTCSSERDHDNNLMMRDEEEEEEQEQEQSNSSEMNGTAVDTMMDQPSHNSNSSYACQLAKRLESIDAMDVVNNSSDGDDEDSNAAMYNGNKQNNNNSNKDDSSNDIKNYSSDCCFSTCSSKRDHDNNLMMRDEEEEEDEEEKEQNNFAEMNGTAADIMMDQPDGEDSQLKKVANCTFPSTLSPPAASRVSASLPPPASKQPPTLELLPSDVGVGSPVDNKSSESNNYSNDDTALKETLSQQSQQRRSQPTLSPSSVAMAVATDQQHDATAGLMLLSKSLSTRTLSLMPKPPPPSRLSPMPPSNSAVVVEKKSTTLPSPQQQQQDDDVDIADDDGDDDDDDSTMWDDMAKELAVVLENTKRARRQQQQVQRNSISGCDHTTDENDPPPLHHNSKTNSSLLSFQCQDNISGEEKNQQLHNTKMSATDNIFTITSRSTSFRTTSSQQQQGPQQHPTAVDNTTLKETPQSAPTTSNNQQQRQHHRRNYDDDSEEEEFDSSDDEAVDIRRRKRMRLLYQQHEQQRRKTTKTKNKETTEKKTSTMRTTTRPNHPIVSDYLTASPDVPYFVFEDEDEDGPTYPEHPDLPNIMTNVDHLSKTEIDNNTPVRYFTVYAGIDTYIYDFKIRIKQSSIGAAGKGAFLTYLGARVLKPELQDHGGKLLRERVPHTPHTMEPLEAVLPPDADGVCYGVTVTLTGTNLHGNNNNIYWPKDKVPSGNLLDASYSDVAGEEVDQGVGSDNKIGFLGIYTENDYVKDPKTEFPVDMCIDLGRYGPFRRSDRKTDTNFSVKSFLFGLKPSIYGFDVSEELDGELQMIDITDDATGLPHDDARNEVLMYINEVGHNKQLQPNVFARESVSLRTQKYYFKSNTKLRAGDTVELLIHYGSKYEHVRERLGYGWKNIRQGLQSDATGAGIRLLRNFEERQDIESIVNSSTSQGLYWIVKFLHKHMSKPLWDDIGCFLKNDDTSIHSSNNKPGSVDQIVAYRRIGWLVDLVRQRIQQPPLLCPCKDMLDDIPAFDLGDSLRSERICGGKTVGGVMQAELGEEILYCMRNHLIKPLDEAVWCPVAVRLIKNLCKQVAEFRSGKKAPDLKTSFLATAEHFAREIDGCIKVNKTADLCFRSGLEGNVYVVGSMQQLMTTSGKMHVVDNSTTVSKSFRATVYETYLALANGNDGPLRRTKNVKAKIRRECLMVSPKVGGGDVKVDAELTSLCSIPKSTTAAAASDSRPNHLWYLVWQVGFIVDVFAQHFLKSGAASTGEEGLYSIDDLCAAMGMEQQHWGLLRFAVQVGMKGELQSTPSSYLSFCCRVDTMNQSKKNGHERSEGRGKKRSCISLQSKGITRMEQGVANNNNNKSPQQPGSKPTPRLVSKGPPDHSLIAGGFPDGWTMEVYERQSGASKGHHDKYWFTPKHHFKLRSKVEIMRYFGHLKSCNGDEIAAYQLIKNKSK